jgi:branched-chain amino acid transport system permease protein
MIFGSFSKNWHLGLGLTLILSVALLPKGLFGIRDQLQKSLPLYLANFKKPPKTKL